MRIPAITITLALAACAGEQQGVRHGQARTLTETGVLTEGGQGTWRLEPEGTTAFPLAIGSSTTVVEGGARVGTDALQPGASARVTYELAPGADEARAVRVEVLPREDAQPLRPATQPGLDVLEPDAGPIMQSPR